MEKRYSIDKVENNRTVVSITDDYTRKNFSKLLVLIKDYQNSSLSDLGKEVIVEEIEKKFKENLSSLNRYFLGYGNWYTPITSFKGKKEVERDDVNLYFQRVHANRYSMCCFSANLNVKIKDEGSKLDAGLSFTQKIDYRFLDLLKLSFENNGGISFDYSSEGYSEIFVNPVDTGEEFVNQVSNLSDRFISFLENTKKEINRPERDLFNKERRFRRAQQKYNSVLCKISCHDLPIKKGIYTNFNKCFAFAHV